MAIQRLQTEYPVTILCQVLAVSKSGYYHWIHRKEKRDQQKSRQDFLLFHIRRIDKLFRQTYGYRRMYEQLLLEGISCRQKEIYELMKQNHIQPKRKRKWMCTTDSNHDSPVSANLVNQTFQTNHPHQVWLGDITYLWSREGFLYLAAVLDLHTRKIIGWSMQTQRQASLIRQALQMALQHNFSKPDYLSRFHPDLWQPGREDNPSLHHFLVFHSDRGSQYASQDYRAMLKENRILSSMSRKGNCYDNAPMESFFHTLKTEATDRLIKPTIAELKACVFHYIESFYNRQRLHSSLGYLSPVIFEEKFYSTQKMNHQKLVFSDMV